MRRSTWRAIGMATAAALAVVACGRSPGGPGDGVPGGPGGPTAPGGAKLDAELVEVDTESVYSGAFGALSDTPVDLRLVLGWGTAGRHAKAEIGQGSGPATSPPGGDTDGGDTDGSDGSDTDDTGGSEGTDGSDTDDSGDTGDGDDTGGAGGDEPSMTYVVVAEDTGCRTPTGAELWRDGDDLHVRFTGGRDDTACFVPGMSIAQFAVDAGAVRGVATIGGEAPVDPRGPGRLESFVELGSALRLGPGTTEPTRLDDRPGVDALYEVLSRSGAADPDEVRAVLDAEPAEGETGLALVLTGCDEDSAVLVVAPESIEAELVGGQGVQCVAPVYFLAVFHLPDEYAPG